MKAVKLYAKVLVDVLGAPGAKYSIDSVLRELTSFAQLSVDSPIALKVFDSPVISDDEKQKVLKAFSSKMDLCSFSENFILMLMKRNRIQILPQILSQVDVIQTEKSGGLIGELVSAVPLDAGAVAAISQAVSKKMNKPVRLKEKVDPSLIAGLRVTVNGLTYDGSIQTKLNQVKASFQ